MADITHGVWIKDGKAIDAVYQGGVKVYGRNILTNTSSSATNVYTSVQGNSIDIRGVYSRADSYEQVIANNGGELFYRFMVPDWTKLYGLTPGETYTLSGSASHTTGELKFRAQYGINGTRWSGDDIGDLEIPVSDGSVFTPFSHTFTIPTGATGVYFSLENFDYTTSSLFRFKNMKLGKGTTATPWSPAPEDILNQEADN